MINFKELSPWTWIIHNDPESAFFKDTKRCKNYYAFLYLGIMGDKNYVMFPIVFDLVKGGQSHLDNIAGPKEIYDKSYTPGDIKSIKSWLSGSSCRLRRATKDESEILDNTLVDLKILVDKKTLIIENTRNLSTESLEDYLYDNILDKLNPLEI